MRILVLLLLVLPHLLDTTINPDNPFALMSDYQVSQKKPSYFKPDRSINNHLFLENPESVRNFYTGKKVLKLNETLRGPMVVVFSNQSKDTYLLAAQYEGNTKNYFSLFEIGYFEDDTKVSKTPAFISKDAIFETESGLGLGSTLEQIIETKGKNYKTRKADKDTIMTYYLSDKHSFVKKHFMPGYFMEFRLRDNKVRRIIFGFEYP